MFESEFHGLNDAAGDPLSNNNSDLDQYNELTGSGSDGFYDDSLDHNSQVDDTSLDTCPEITPSASLDHSDSNLPTEAGAMPSDAAGPHVTLEINGQTSTLSATVDSDHDGDKDTAVVDVGGGEQLVITDRDADNVADDATLIGTDGQVIGTSYVVDPATGEWVEATTLSAPAAGNSTHAPDGQIPSNPDNSVENTDQWS